MDLPEIRINTSSVTARKASGSRQFAGSSVFGAWLFVVLASTAALWLFGGFLSKARSKGNAKGRPSTFAHVQGSTTASSGQNSKRKQTRSSPEPSELEKERYAQGWDRGVNDGAYLAKALRQLVEDGNNTAAEKWLQNIANIVNSSLTNLDNADKGVKLLEQRWGSVRAGSPESDYLIQHRAGRAECLGRYEGLMSVVGKYVQ